MVTKAELKKASKSQARQEAVEKKARDLEHKKWIKQYTAEIKKRAEGLLDGELGEFLTWANTQKLNTVFLDHYRCWKPSKHWKRDQIYDTKFRLDFTPEPDSAATKLLIKKLQDAGFEAEVLTETVGNVEWGYDGEMRDAPGYHDEYYLKISW